MQNISWGGMPPDPPSERASRALLLSPPDQLKFASYGPVKVCLMRLKRLKYENRSAQKTCFFKLSSLDIAKSEIESSSIIIADSELHEKGSTTTLEGYLHQRKSGITRTTYSLYVPVLEEMVCSTGCVCVDNCI